MASLEVNNNIQEVNNNIQEVESSPQKVQRKKKPLIDWNDKEQIKQYQREMYHKTKETQTKTRINKVDWTNYEEVKQYRKKYYELNREKIVELKQEKVLCPLCQKEVNKDSLIKHNRSQLHKIALRLVSTH
ncbi:MAG: hypothetical protein EBU90_20325 [Proteobacteria bacterium]|nr:hypothetical protein [Pseudomonadota bacterium]